MLTLNDGRNELWQWDTGRKLTVDADCSQVHFSNKVFGRSIDVDVVDGVAIIPDILLQTDKNVAAWAFVGTAENGYTKISKTFKVNRRNKPADYVFTPTEQITLGEIAEQIDDLRQEVDDIKDNQGTGGNVDLTGYATKQFVRDGFQPKGNYLTEHQPIKTLNGQSLVGTGNLEISGVEKEIVVPPLRAHLIPIPVAEDFYSGKKIGFIGDSITAGVGATETSERYTTVLSTMLGSTEVNKSVSGTVLCTGGHRTCNIDKLTAANFEGCSAVLIMMGINDWDQAKADYYALGEYGSTDTTTIYGAVDMWCKRIEEIRNTAGFEDTKFYFITPIITSWNQSVGGRNWDQNKTNIHGFKLRDLCQAIINVCADYDVPVLDMNKYSGIYYNSATDNTVNEYFGDGIHPNSAGHEQIAIALREYLLENLTYASQDKATEYAINYLLQSVLADARKVTYPTFGDSESDVVEVESITLTPATLSLTAGETATITHTFIPSDTTQTNIIWTTSNAAIATVRDGVVTAVAQGNATITCQSADNSGVSATVALTVNAATSTDLTALVLSDEAVTVEAGKTHTMTVTYVPASTEQKGVVWTSDDTNVATVEPSADGLSCVVTAVNGGQCYITVKSTVNSAISDSCLFTTSAVEEDEPDSDTYTLGKNVTLNDDGTLSGSATGTVYSSLDNVAFYNMALKAGMEVEVVEAKVGNNFGSFCGWGVDTIKKIEELELTGVFPKGKFNFYYDTTSTDAVKSIVNITSDQYTLLESGKNVSPRTAILKRDASGVLSGTFNGVAVNMPSTDVAPNLAIANSAEKLYVWIGGINANTTWKINYFGPLR